MRVTVICNAHAGKRVAPAAARSAGAVFTEAGWEVKLCPTSGPDTAADQARLATGESDLVLACGGDGTLSEVLNGLRDSGRPGGLIPAGTGNDFARTVGLSLDPVQAARQVLGGYVRPIDLLEIAGSGWVAVNVIGVGFDAAVAWRMNTHTRRLGGLAAYLCAVALELVRFRPTPLHLWVDGEQWHGDALLVAIANAQSYGAGMRIAPRASVQDGLLDVVLVERMSRLEFLRSLPLVFRGSHLSHPRVRMWQAREVRVETERPGPVLVDGDLRGETPLTVRVLPGAARFCLPGESAPSAAQ